MHYGLKELFLARQYQEKNSLFFLLPSPITRNCSELNPK